MADDSEDLVGKVDIEGVDETVKKLDELGDKGSEAFNKVADAAKKAGDTIKKSTTDIDKGSTNAKTSLDNIGKADVGAKTVAPNLNAIEAASRQLFTGVRNGIKDLAQFGVRLAALGSAGAAAAGGLLVAARNIAQSVSTQTSAADENLKAQQAALTEQGDADKAAIQYQSSLRQLNTQLANGTITYDQYAASLKTTRQSYIEQQRVAEQLAFDQETLRLETEKLQKQAADTKAWDALTDKFGGPLTSSLVALGNQVETIRKDFVAAFSPALASAIDAIVSVISANQGAISGFIGSASQQIQTFISSNAPAIQQALTSIGDGAKSIFAGIIAAAPSLLSFFNGTLVPAIQTVYGYIQSLVAGINSLFGSNITTGFLLITAAVIKFSGAMKLAIDAINIGVGAIRLITFAFSPWLVVLGLVAAALYLLYTNVDWTALAAKVTAFGAAIVSWFSNLPATIGGFFSAVWDGIKNGAQAAVDIVIALWQSFVDWLAALPQKIVDLFGMIGTAILDAFNSAIEKVKQYFTDLYNSAVQYIKPIIDMLTTVASLLGLTGGGGGDAATIPALAGGGHVGPGPVRGPGTSTSDSIIAWLSNNEYVVRARAVAKYGRGFLDAINSGRLSLNSLRGYAVGGLVTTPSLPQLARGDVTRDVGQNMRPFTLKIGDQTFANLLAPDDVADSMVKFSVTKQSRSAGRRPTWR